MKDAGASRSELGEAHDIRAGSDALFKFEAAIFLAGGVPGRSAMRWRGLRIKQKDEELIVRL
jgi:hypothetical protein